MKQDFTWSYRTQAAGWSGGKKGCEGVLGQATCAAAASPYESVLPSALCSLSLCCHPRTLLSLSFSESPEQFEFL